VVNEKLNTRHPKLKQTLQDAARGSGCITVLTGAGISAESNIPTFRGPEGYWTIGSKHYYPQEMATFRRFMQNPDEVWKWYLYRIGVCKKAIPNPGHLAIVEMEKLFGDRFTLITQNVDNLHLRAGNSLKRTLQIHGNIFYMRCLRECTQNVYAVPEDLTDRGKHVELTEKDRALLACPDCGSLARPHVLWFDEFYNEHFYHYQTSLKVAGRTELLIIAGASGATNLPNQIAWEVASRNNSIIDINIEENPFSNLALTSWRGGIIKAPSSKALSNILKIFKET